MSSPTGLAPHRSAESFDVIVLVGKTGGRRELSGFAEALRRLATSTGITDEEAAELHADMVAMMQVPPPVSIRQLCRALDRCQPQTSRRTRTHSSWPPPLGRRGGLYRERRR
jgi:hypothetical protein